MKCLGPAHILVEHMFCSVLGVLTGFPSSLGSDGGGCGWKWC